MGQEVGKRKGQEGEAVGRGRKEGQVGAAEGEGKWEGLGGGGGGRRRVKKEVGQGRL